MEDTVYYNMEINVLALDRRFDTVRLETTPTLEGRIAPLLLSAIGHDSVVAENEPIAIEQFIEDIRLYRSGEANQYVDSGRPDVFQTGGKIEGVELPSNVALYFPAVPAGEIEKKLQELITFCDAASKAGATYIIFPNS